MGMPDMISRAAANTADLAKRIDALDLEAPSTCSEWDVRGLVNHMASFLPYSANAARKGAPMEGDAPDLAADPAWAASYGAMAQDLAAAWSEDDAMEGMVQFGQGEMPADAAAGITLMELTVHGWDLARSTGTAYSVDEDIAGAVHAIVEGAAGGGPSDFFHPPVEVASDASSLEQALGLSGRDPR